MKHKGALLFYDQIEQILILYGNDDIKWKIEFVKNFLKENFGVDDFEDSYVDIERLHSKRLMWLFVSLIIDYETTKEKPNEQLSKLNGFGDSTSQKMKITEQKTRKLKNVDEIFPTGNRTVQETQFVDRCLDKMHVDLESEDNQDIILCPKQLIFLLQGIIRGWDTFKEKSKKKNEE